MRVWSPAVREKLDMSLRLSLTVSGGKAAGEEKAERARHAAASRTAAPGEAAAAPMAGEAAPKPRGERSSHAGKRAAGPGDVQARKSAAVGRARAKAVPAVDRQDPAAAAAAPPVARPTRAAAAAPAAGEDAAGAVDGAAVNAIRWFICRPCG